MATYKSIRYIVPVEAVEHTDSINALSDVDTNTTAPTDGQILKWNNTNSKWYPGNVEGEVSTGGTQKAIIAFGENDTVATNTTFHISGTGTTQRGTNGIGTDRTGLAAAGYGGDKAIFGFGNSWNSYNDVNGSNLNLTNLVSNTGNVATDSTGVGTARTGLAASGYGGDKAIFGFGNTSSLQNITNLVSNIGVVATDTTGVGTARKDLAAAGYGEGKAIFGFGNTSSLQNITNLVSNTGVVSTDTTGVGTARSGSAAAGYGGDKAIFGFGYATSYTNTTNLVSNLGVVATDTTGVGTARKSLGASSYGGDKALFAFGYGTGDYGDGRMSAINFVSNTGVVATDGNTTNPDTVYQQGQAKHKVAAAGYSTTA